jgi:eukaryotic-like serine/threonine-protein kinase
MSASSDPPEAARTGAGSGDGTGGDETLAATDAASVDAPSSVELTQGAMVGRYVVLSRLGMGGMGVVYAAYDPELDRKVAVKLLLHERGSTTARARLLREAQALARLSHPNVVAVHDVGMHDRGSPQDGESQPAVFVAMEFVRGETLRAWPDRAHRWPETFAMMMQAGRGLAAAHAEGLVHRDFKPVNASAHEIGRSRA